MMTDEDKLRDYPLVREKLEEQTERLGRVYSTIRAFEMVQSESKLTKMIKEEVFPLPEGIDHH